MTVSPPRFSRTSPRVRQEFGQEYAKSLGVNEAVGAWERATRRLVRSDTGGTSGWERWIWDEQFVEVDEDEDIQVHQEGW